MPNFGSFGTFESLYFVGHRVDPEKKHSLALRNSACFDPLCIKVHSLATGHFSRRGRRKITKNEKNKALYFTLFAQTLYSDPFVQSLGYAISCAKFYRNRLKGLDFVKGRSLNTPIGMRCRR